MKSLLAFVVMLILCSSCQYEDRQTARSQVKEIASNLSHPSGSAVVLTVDELLGSGSSETCSGSDKFYFIGSSLSRADIKDYYDRQFGSGWSKHIETDFTGWSKVNDRFRQTVGIAFENTWLESSPSYLKAVVAARTQYSTTYELSIISLTADTCKGG